LAELFCVSGWGTGEMVLELASPSAELAFGLGADTMFVDVDVEVSLAHPATVFTIGFVQLSD
jgi:hypothetical protein